MSNPRGLSIQKSTTTQSGEDLNAATRGILYDLQAQANSRTAQRGISNRRPAGTKRGDTTTRIANGNTVAVATYDSKGKFIEKVLPSDINSSVAFKTGAVPPVVADYPNDGDNGQFYDTALQQLYIVRNYLGTLIYPNFVSISGTISAAQHGDLSGAGATPMHAFTQMAGAITAAQHGSLAGGALHDAATGAANGFMTAADFTKLANAVSTATASRLVIRDATAGAAFGGTLTAAAISASGNINTTTFYEVDGVQVVKEQQAAIAGADGTLADATTKLNLVIGRLRAHGLIAT